MNIEKFANHLKDSRLKHGKLYASLVCKWYLLVAMPILSASIAIAYLYFQPTKYTASATFGKINNLDESVNAYIIKYIKSSELIEKSATRNCSQGKDNISK